MRTLNADQLMTRNKSRYTKSYSNGSAVGDDHWNDLKSRRKDLNHTEIIGVKTTGIYCKFGCSARTPNRENILIYENTKLAQQDGFRACKKCKPDLN